MKACLVVASCRSLLRTGFLLVLASLLGTSGAQEAPKASLAEADKLFQQQKWQEAGAAYQRTLSRETDWHSALGMRALERAVECALKLGEWDEAWARIHHFRSYKPKPPDDPNLQPYWGWEEERKRGELPMLESIRLLLSR